MKNIPPGEQEDVFQTMGKSAFHSLFNFHSLTEEKRRQVAALQKRHSHFCAL